MDAGERVSWTECPLCGGLAAVGWLDEEPIEVDCAGGCALLVEQVQLSAARQDPGDPLGDVGQMASILEGAVVGTAEAYGLNDFRPAADLVAKAWAEVLREEGRSPRLVSLATAAVGEVGARLDRRQSSVTLHSARDTSMDIRVLVVDDHPLARLRLTEMLAGEADLSVVGECENGPEVVAAAARLRPHVVCLDRHMPTVAALAATNALRAAHAGVRIVVLTTGSGLRREAAALAGADALVPAGASRDAVLRCLRTAVHKGADCPYCL